MTTRRRATGVLAAVLVVLLGIATSTGAGGGGHAADPLLTIDLPNPAPQSSVPTPTAQPSGFLPHATQGGSLLPAGAGRVLAVLLGIVVTALVVRFVARVVRRVEVRTPDEATASAVPAPVVVDADELATEAGRAADELRLSGDVRAAIVDCWRRLEDLCARSGAVRQPWQSTGEYVVAVLAGTPAPPGELRTLARLYDDACYAPTDPGPAQRDAAIAALHGIAAAIAHDGGAR